MSDAPEFLQGPVPGKGTMPEAGEISSPLGSPAGAGRVSDVGRYYAGTLLTNPDDLVQAAKGGGLKLFEKVLQDEQVYSTFQQRRSALIAKEVSVEPGADDKASRAAADFFREMLSGMEWDDITDKMMYGIFYGYGVAECLYAADGSKWFIDDVKVRKARRFRYDREGQLRLTSATSQTGVLMPDRKFWTFSSGADNHDNPYGIGLASRCYWPSFFKRNGLRYWMLALEKYGAPTAVGKYPVHATKQEKDKLLDAVAAFAAVSGLTIPEGMDISLLTAGSKVGGNHDALISMMDRAISKVVLSQTMTTDDGSSNSQSETHMDVREDITRADSDLINGSFMSGPGRWLMEWNFPTATAPKLSRNTEAAEDLDKNADRDAKIYSIGFEPTEEHILATYGSGYRKRPATSQSDGRNAAAAPSPSFSQGVEPLDAIDAYTGGDEHFEALQEEMDDVITDFEDILDGAETLEEARDMLFGAMAMDKEDPFAKRLARLTFFARMHGRALEGDPEKV